MVVQREKSMAVRMAQTTAALMALYLVDQKVVYWDDWMAAALADLSAD